MVERRWRVSEIGLAADLGMQLVTESTECTEILRTRSLAFQLICWTRRAMILAVSTGESDVGSTQGKRSKSGSVTRTLASSWSTST